MRKLASVRKISEINPIPGADAIEVASIDGWKVVVKKGEFKAGDLAVYCEIDSWIPHALAPFLSKGQEPREFNGVKGERLRTVKLRGQVSQGLLLPIEEVFPGKERDFFWSEIGNDISEALGIQKWEAPIPAELAGQVEGPFPGWMRKTDQERCQNLVPEIFGYEDTLVPFDYESLTEEAKQAMHDEGLITLSDGKPWKVNKARADRTARYEVTIKLDGSSMTVFARGTIEPSDRSLVQMESGVCSRNLQLKVNAENANNTLVRVAVQSGLLGILENIARNGRSYCVQGEIMGPGIQGNRENLKTHQFFVFDVQDLNSYEYLVPSERRELMDELYEYGVDANLVKHVPVLAAAADLSDTLGIKNIGDLLAFADGKSLNHEVREGVVFKRTDGKFSFKAISNKFLLNGGD